MIVILNLYLFIYLFVFGLGYSSGKVLFSPAGPLAPRFAGVRQPARPSVRPSVIEYLISRFTFLFVRIDGSRAPLPSLDSARSRD